MSDHRLEIVLTAKDITGAAFKKFEGRLKSITKAVFSLNGVLATLAGGYGIQRVATSFLDAGVSLDRMERSLAAATGTAKAAAVSQAYLRKESERLGLVFEDQVKGYIKLAAASRNTALEGDATKDVFLGIAEAVTALQLTSEEAQGAIYAVQQMMSKGTVTAEELKRQLGDRLPGAFQAASRAMGVSTEEMNKMLRRGEIMAVDFLPKLAKELHKTYGEAAVNASKSAQAAINRLINTWFDLRNTIMKAGVLDEVATQIKNITDGTRAWIEANEDLIKQKVPEYIGNIKSALGGIWDIVSYDPAIIEWGLVGLAIGGRKGAILMGGLAHMKTWAENLSAALGMVSVGILDVSQVANANFKELEALVSGVGKGDLMALLESQAQRVKAEVESLAKIVEGRVFYFAGDKERLAALRVELKAINAQIERVAKNKATSELAKRLAADSDALKSSIGAALAATAKATPKITGYTEEQAKAIDKIITRLKEQAETVGMTERQILEYTLTNLEANSEDRKRAFVLYDQAAAYKANQEAIKATEAAAKELSKALDEAYLLSLPDLDREIEEINRKYLGAVMNIYDAAGKDPLTADMKKMLDGLYRNWDAAVAAAKSSTEEISEDTRSIFDDMWDDVSNMSIEEWKDMWGSLEAITKRAIFNMAQEMLLQPIIMPVVQGAANSLQSAMSGNLSIGSLGLGSFGGLSSGISSFLGSSVLNPGAVDPLTGLPISLGPGTGTGISWGNMLGTAGLYSAGTNLLGSMFGLPETSGAGSFATTALTSLFTTNPLTLALSAVGGTFLEDFVGGLFGDEKDWRVGPYSDVNFGFGNTPNMGSRAEDIAQWGEGNWNIDPQDAVRQTVIETTSAVYDQIDAILEALPSTASESILSDLNAMDITLPLEGRMFNSNSEEKFRADIEELVGDVQTTLWDAVTPAITEGLAEQMQRSIGDALGSGAWDNLAADSAIRQMIPDMMQSGIMTGVYGMAEGADFAQYAAGATEFLAAISQVGAVFTGIDTTIDGILNPLSDFDQGLADINAQFDGFVLTAEAVGASIEYITEKEEERAQALQNYTINTANDINAALNDQLNKLTMSDEDYETWQATSWLKDTLLDIWALGEGYEFLEDKAREVYDAQIEGLNGLGLAAADFLAVQMKVAGYSDAEVAMRGISNKYNWGEQFVSNGQYNWESIINEGVAPVLAMSAEEFQAMADAMGYSTDELMADVLTVSDAFRSLGDEATETASIFSDLSKSIGDQMLSMQTSIDNPADIRERIGIQESAIEDYMGGQSLHDFINSLGGAERATAIADLSTMLGDKLSLYQEGYDRPSGTYMGAYESVLTDLGTLKGYADLIKTDYDLQYEQTDYLRAIADNTAGLSDIPQFADGGWTGPGGLAFTHPNELVLNPQQQQAVLNQPASAQNGPVYITINLNGGSSEDQPRKIVQEIKRQIPQWNRTEQDFRVSIQRTAEGR